MGMKFVQSQKQIQKVSPQLVQSMEILQMTSQELCSYIYDETIENPVIDMDALNMNDIRSRLDWLRRSSEGTVRKERPADDGDESSPAGCEAAPSAENSLQEHLRMQLVSMRLSPLKRHICRYLTDCVDSRGYLDEDAEETAELLGTETEEVEECIEIMRSLSPAGVCAKDMRSCLLAQLELQGGDEICARIIEGQLERLAKGHYSYIAKELGTDTETVRKAAERIKTLTPVPASEFSDERDSVAAYLIPDAQVAENEAGEPEISIVNPYTPCLRTSSYYDELYRTTDDEELKAYLDTKLRAAGELINGVSMREKTVAECINAIFSIQKEYLCGRREALMPMTLQDIAELTGLSTATVSRAVRGKNIQCRRGIIPLKNLFAQKLSQPFSGEHSSDEAMKMIRELVDGENKSKPLSDRQLCEKLAEAGIEISRRTAAKYREKMEIPGTFARKQTEEEK